MRASVNLPRLPAGAEALVDPNDPYIARAIANKVLVPVDETTPAPPAEMPVEAPVEPVAVTEAPAEVVAPPAPPEPEKASEDVAPVAVLEASEDVGPPSVLDTLRDTFSEGSFKAPAPPGRTGSP